MNAYEAILEALIARERTGEGAELSISMFDAMADWMTVPLLQQEAGVPPQRIGLAHTSISPYGAFKSRDGVDILISIQSDREWRVLGGKGLGRCRARGRSGLCHQCRTRQTPRRNRRQGRQNLRRARRGSARAKARAPPISLSPASTVRPISRAIRICAASPWARRAVRCPIRRRPNVARRRGATARCRRWASIPRRCARNSPRLQ